MKDFGALDAVCQVHPVDSDRALHSLYGKGNTVRALTGTGSRPQEIYTPQPIKDALAILWPEGVSCDPCSGPGSIIDAAIRYCVPRRVRTVLRKGKPVEQEYYEAQDGDTDGLALPWARHTYVNFPFDSMRAWLEKAAGEPREQVILCPVRTHRDSYRDFTELCDQVIWLNYNIKFLGFKGAFPAPLSILYRGDRDAAAAFAAIGRKAKIK